MKLTQPQRRLLFEALRRETLLTAEDKAKPKEKQWLGLGTAAAYRPMIEAGLMQFHDGKTPPPRCQGWLVFTPLGLQVLDEHRGRLEIQLYWMLQNTDYQNSVASQYQLAGAIVAK